MKQFELKAINTGKPNGVFIRDNNQLTLTLNGKDTGDFTAGTVAFSFYMKVPQEWTKDIEITADNWTITKDTTVKDTYEIPHTLFEFIPSQDIPMNKKVVFNISKFNIHPTEEDKNPHFSSYIQRPGKIDTTLDQLFILKMPNDQQPNINDQIIVTATRVFEAKHASNLPNLTEYSSGLNTTAGTVEAVYNNDETYQQHLLFEFSFEKDSKETFKKGAIILIYFDFSNDEKDYALCTKDNAKKITFSDKNYDKALFNINFPSTFATDSIITITVQDDVHANSLKNNVLFSFQLDNIIVSKPTTTDTTAIRGHITVQFKDFEGYNEGLTVFTYQKKEIEKGILSFSNISKNLEFYTDSKLEIFFNEGIDPATIKLYFSKIKEGEKLPLAGERVYIKASEITFNLSNIVTYLDAPLIYLHLEGKSYRDREEININSAVDIAPIDSEFIIPKTHYENVWGEEITFFHISYHAKKLRLDTLTVNGSDMGIDKDPHHRSYPYNGEILLNLHQICTKRGTQTLKLSVKDIVGRIREAQITIGNSDFLTPHIIGEDFYPSSGTYEISIFCAKKVASVKVVKKGSTALPPVDAEHQNGIMANTFNAWTHKFGFAENGAKLLWSATVTDLNGKEVAFQQECVHNKIDMD